MRERFDQSKFFYFTITLGKYGFISSMKALAFVLCSVFSGCSGLVSDFDFALSFAFRVLVLPATALGSRFFAPFPPSLIAVS